MSLETLYNVLITQILNRLPLGWFVGRGNKQFYLEYQLVDALTPDTASTDTTIATVTVRVVFKDAVSYEELLNVVQRAVNGLGDANWSVVEYTIDDIGFNQIEAIVKIDTWLGDFV